MGNIIFNMKDIEMNESYDLNMTIIKKDSTENKTKVSIQEIDVSKEKLIFYLKNICNIFELKFGK